MMMTKKHKQVSNLGIATFKRDVGYTDGIDDAVEAVMDHIAGYDPNEPNEPRRRDEEAEEDPSP